ncbi:NAD(P)H-dependent oxidoreductase [Mobilitalea sibirica]|uniref:FMN dependent NADH:quinone oxidoreductase n=1 Tax=Mobilitalea sibirica TaxID=1462919 RepID=A0A8J7HCA4_9FIRM|nr:NAD(P)H-dependent oxidoreductase [Mobilitalea sibirica]MBH1940777.1 NAD(P)H-dependent oxidoreductase [Mobilitalea sibirica]
MKQLLYITCNSKPENMSASKTVGRAFVDSFLKNHRDYELKEIDLFDLHLPRLNYKYYKDRNSLVDGDDYNRLTQDEKIEVDRIKELATEFTKADTYVIAAPMWSLMFPAPLKEYLDCIIQKDISIKMGPGDIGGLLDDKERNMVYIQSSGGGIPWFLERKMNHGGTYLKDIFKFIGIKNFYEVLVDSTGFTKEELHDAVEKGKQDAKTIAEKIA